MDFVKTYFVLFLAFNSKAFLFAAKDWWKYTTIYEIYLPSFKDSNGDGIGDLKGVTSKLDHLVDLGVETVWITPFFKSTMLDMGYDIENYTSIEPTYGTMNDFDELMKELKKRVSVTTAYRGDLSRALWIKPDLSHLFPWLKSLSRHVSKLYNRPIHSVTTLRDTFLLALPSKQMFEMQKSKKINSQANLAPASPSYLSNIAQNITNTYLMISNMSTGLKLIVDFVINHTSDKHSWFTKSIDRIEPYTNFYVWADAKGFEKNGDPIPPNNWIGVYGDSAWTWNKKRKQFYFHQFIKAMPDLNLRDPTLINELKKILTYWFQKGVAGGRLDAAKHFMEDLQLRDEPLLDPKNQQKYIRYEHLNHIYTTDQNDTYVFIHKLKDFVDNAFSNKDEKILIPEAFTDVEHVMKYYGTPDYKISNFPFNFHFVPIYKHLTAKDFDFLIQSWLKKMPAHGVANWGFENHDQDRVGKRFNRELCDILLITVMMLPGVAFVYYGQEIGMVNNKIGAGETRIPKSHSIHHWDTPDESRLPMQWDNTMNAGFTSNSKPWLPVNPEYWHVNVETQKRQPGSRYKLFKILSKLRGTATRTFGDFKSYIFSHWVYGFSRHVADEPMILVLLNLGTETEMVTLNNRVPYLPDSLTVLAASANAGYKRGQRIKTKPKFPQEITLRPVSGIVLSSLDKRKGSSKKNGKSFLESFDKPIIFPQ